MTDSYCRFRREARKELEEFKKDKFFKAYKEDTYREGLARLGIAPEDAENVLTEDPIGEYTITAEIPAIEAKKQEIENRKRELIRADPDGSNFVYEMFLNENLEHGYRQYYDDQDESQEPWGDYAITITGLTPEEVKQDPKLSNGLRLALDKLDKTDICGEYLKIWNRRAREYCSLGASEYDTESEAKREIRLRYEAEIRKGIDHDIDGSEFIRGMFFFEGKEECTKTLALLGYDEETIEQDPRFRNGLALAEYLRARDW